MGILDDIGKGLVDGLQSMGQSFKDAFESQKKEYNKKIFLKDVLLDKKYDFDLKVEEDRLTFTNHSGSSFVRTLENSPLFVVFWSIAMLGFIMLIINSNSEFTCLFMLMIFGSILSSLFIFTFFKTKVYFTITPQGIEVKTNKSRVFIDRDNISDIYLDVQGLANEGGLSNRNKKSPIIFFSIYLKTLQEIYLPDLKTNKSFFDFFYSDHMLLTKLFVVVFLNEAKRILNLPRENEYFGTGLKNITILKADDSEFVFEKKNQCKIIVNKYQVKIEEQGIFGNKNNREISIQNTSSFRIFETVINKRILRRANIGAKIGRAIMENTEVNLDLFNNNRKNNNLGLALCEDYSSNKPNILVKGINLDEAVYILRKIRAYVGRN